MSVAGIQGGNLPSSFPVSQQSQSQQTESTSQTGSLTAEESNSSTIPAASSIVESAQALRLSEFETFVHDIQSGNLVGALQALTDLRQELQSVGVHSSAPTSVSDTPVSTSAGADSSSGSHAANLNKLEQDFDAIGTALSSGNLSQAQQAFSQFSQDAQDLLSSPDASSSQSGSLSQVAALGSELLHLFSSSESALAPGNAAKIDTIA